MKNSLSSYRLLILVAGVIVILDQITKILVRSNLGEGEIWSPWKWLLPYARIVHIHNSGAAFGMLPGFGGVFTVLAVIVAIAILYYFPRVPRDEWVLRLALCLQFGGAIGNLIDRLHQGYVTDFISVMTFAVFNIADASITIGVAILILSMWFKEQKKDPSENTRQSDPSGEAAGAAVAEDATGE